MVQLSNKYGRITLFLIFLILNISKTDAQERMASLDGAGNIFTLDATLENKLSLFPTYSGFKQAQFFQVSDSLFALEIMYLEGTTVLKTRIPHTMEEYNSFKKKVDDRISELAKSGQSIGPNFGQKAPKLEGVNVYKEEEVSGRGILLTGLTLMGFSFYGGATAVILDLKESRAFGGYLLTGATSFLLPMYLTMDQHVSLSEASLALYGSGIGVGHGFLLYATTMGDEPNFNDNSQRLAFSTAFVTSVFETYAGFHYARKHNLSLGQANLMGSMGLWGSAFGGGIAAILNPGVNIISGTILTSSVIGAAVGRSMGRLQSYSHGDAIFVNITTFMSAFAGFGVATAIDFKDWQAYVASGLIGGISGTYLGNKLSKPVDFSRNDAIMIGLSTIAGAVTTYGLTTLIGNKQNQGQKFMISTTIGSIIGYSIMYKNSLKNRLQSASASRVQLELSPQCMINPAYGSALYDLGSPSLVYGLKFGIKF